MAAVTYTEKALADIVRLAQFLLDSEPQAAASTGALIEEALAILARHPLVGRPAGERFHELLISRGRTGYVALYEYDARTDHVIVHAIRHQRETGFEE